MPVMLRHLRTYKKPLGLKRQHAQAAHVKKKKTPREKKARSRRAVNESTPPTTKHTPAQGTTDFVVSTSTKNKKWIRPKGFGRQPDGSGPGRKKGTLSRVTKEIRSAIQLRGMEVIERLFDLAHSYDGQVAHQACKTLLLYGYGRPTIHVEIDTTKKKTYVTEMPKAVSHDEWLNIMKNTYGRAIIDVTKAAVRDDDAETNDRVQTNGHLAASNGSMNGNHG